LFYVGVYVGEAVSGQIATAFNKTGTPWNSALKAIGIVGMVLAVVTRILLREPKRRSAIVPLVQVTDDSIFAPPLEKNWKFAHAKRQIVASVSQIVRMRSFWLLTLSAGARQFSGNVFGYYMPSYLSSIYPSETTLLSRYGIIVGVVGLVAVISGGFICSSLDKWRPIMPLYLTGIGGMVSAIFVILMVFSRILAGGDESKGVRILYGVMSAAYLTAELWLGAFASLLALLLPPQTKTFCLAIYTCTIILIYSSAPQIIGLALRDYEPESPAYIDKTRDILAILIPIGYWVAGVGFLFCINKVKRDLRGDIVEVGRTSWRRKGGFIGFLVILISLTIALSVTSLVLR
jgi:MFS family permease